MPSTFKMKGESTRPKITSPDMVEECKHILDVEEGDKSIDTENGDVVHSNINENESETTNYTSEYVIYKCLYEKYPVVM